MVAETRIESQSPIAIRVTELDALDGDREAQTQSTTRRPRNFARGGSCYPADAVRITTERGRDIRDGLLATHAVAGRIEWRRDHRDSPVAWRHREQSTTDAALGREPCRE